MKLPHTITFSPSLRLMAEPKMQNQSYYQHNGEEIPDKPCSPKEVYNKAYHNILDDPEPDRLGMF